MLIVIYEPKKLKKFVLIFLCYTDPSVYYRYFNELILILCHDLNLYRDISVLSELQSIRLQP